MRSIFLPDCSKLFARLYDCCVETNYSRTCSYNLIIMRILAHKDSGGERGGVGLCLCMCVHCVGMYVWPC